MAMTRHRRHRSLADLREGFDVDDASDAQVDSGEMVKVHVRLEWMHTVVQSLIEYRIARSTGE